MSTEIRLAEIRDLLIDFIDDSVLFNTNDEKTGRFWELREEIVEDLMWKPGALISTSSKDESEQFKSIIDFLWKDIHPEFIEEDIFEGDYNGIISELVGNFATRVVKIKPTFISINNATNSEFEVYFNEAMKAWLYGAPNSALIICNSLLEDIIRNKLCLINSEYALRLISLDGNRSNSSFGMQDLKNFAKKEKLIPNNLIENLSQIQRARNNAVHNLDVITDDEVYELILNTKDIVEHLLNN